MQPTFPDCPYFAWAFCLVPIAITGLAAYTDLRTTTIPKTLTLPALSLGIVFNLIRGAWVGGDSAEVGALMGGLHGLLLALGGFVVGFGLFFILWIMGACGGGDVKLFAAVGAWVGPILAIYLLLLTIVCVAVFSMGRFAYRLMSGRSLALAGASVTGARRKAKERLIYAPSLVVSTTALLMYFFRAELHLRG